MQLKVRLYPKLITNGHVTSRALLFCLFFFALGHRIPKFWVVMLCSSYPHGYDELTQKEKSIEPDMAQRLNPPNDGAIFIVLFCILK